MNISINIIINENTIDNTGIYNHSKNDNQKCIYINR